jgi:hypothetical protein
MHFFFQIEVQFLLKFSRVKPFEDAARSDEHRRQHLHLNTHLTITVAAAAPTILLAAFK